MYSSKIQGDIVRSSKKLFYAVWLVFGLFQVALVRDSNAATVLQSASATQTDPNSEGNTSSATASVPVRISRSLFDNSTLTSSAQFSGEGQPQQYSSSVHWDEASQPQAHPVNLIGPQPIASYDNHTGCAEFTNISPLQLCFTIQSDVSSLTLNADQMSLAGLQSIVDPSCISQTKFVKATKNSDNTGFTVQYQLQETADPRCTGKGGTLNLTVQSTQTAT